MRLKLSPVLANLVLLLSLFACQAAPSPVTLTPVASLAPVRTPSPTPGVTPRPSATIAPKMLAHLDEALEIIQRKSFFSAQIDWPVVRQFAYRLAAGSTDSYVTDRAIQAVISKTSDTHGYILNPSQARAFLNDPVNDQSIPAGQLLSGRIGLLTLPGFANADQAKISEFAMRFQREIRKLDAQNPCGWVLDLRKNSGGSVWAMLAGVGPLLGQGTSAYFEDTNGKKYAIGYRAGQALSDQEVTAQISAPAYQLRQELPPVAILTAPVTASAAELIMIAFRGRPNARSFGQPTAGLASAIETFQLSDGSLLGLTTAIDLDRNGHAYGLFPIAPDQLTDMPVDGSPPPAALDWLRSQPACR